MKDETSVFCFDRCCFWAPRTRGQDATAYWLARGNRGRRSFLFAASRGFKSFSLFQISFLRQRLFSFCFQPLWRNKWSFRFRILIIGGPSFAYNDPYQNIPHRTQDVLLWRNARLCERAVKVFVRFQKTGCLTTMFFTPEERVLLKFVWQSDAEFKHVCRNSIPVQHLSQCDFRWSPVYLRLFCIQSKRPLPATRVSKTSKKSA